MNELYELYECFTLRSSRSLLVETKLNYLFERGEKKIHT